jgi:hypothetical protein
LYKECKGRFAHITVAKEIKYILQIQKGVVWTGLIWFRIGTSERLL